VDRSRLVDLSSAPELDLGALSDDLRSALGATYEVSASADPREEGLHLLSCPSAGSGVREVLPAGGLHALLAWCCEEEIPKGVVAQLVAVAVKDHRRIGVHPVPRTVGWTLRRFLDQFEPALAEQVEDLVGEVEADNERWVQQCGLKRLLEEVGFAQLERYGQVPRARWYEGEALVLEPQLLVKVRPTSYDGTPSAVTLSEIGADAWCGLFGGGDVAFVPQELKPLLEFASVRGHDFECFEADGRVGETARALALGGMNLREALTAAEALES
jgi:hypothetical protein